MKQIKFEGQIYDVIDETPTHYVCFPYYNNEWYHYISKERAVEVMDNLIYNLKFAQNTYVGDVNAININVVITKGITTEQAKEINNQCSDYMVEYDIENNGDYENFDYYEMIESVLKGLGIEHKYPEVDCTIYL